MIKNKTSSNLLAGSDRFPSLTALRLQHSALLKRYRQENSELPLREIEHLVQKGQSTGKLLDKEDDRWAAQSILDYWSSLLYREEQRLIDVTLLDFDPSLSPELDDSLCPYVGLDAFREDSKHLFFGRQQLLNQLLDKASQNSLIAVVGSSGSGKSSVVLGGLIPKLKAGGLLDSENWHYYKPFVPGSKPLEALVDTIYPQYVKNKEWTKQQIDGLKSDSSHLSKIIDLEHGQKRVVLVIDQFEELFTLCNNNEIRQIFVDNLKYLTEVPEKKHIVILTMRSDFEDKVARLKKFQQLFISSQVRVVALDASELREAIEKPAELIGLKFEDGLIDELVEDILGEPAALPLLQFTLLKLWESRQYNRITWESYKKTGGGRSALAKSANEFYNALIPEEQEVAKRIILKMVRPTEGLEVTSNRTLKSDLDYLGYASDRVERVLEKLIRSHLVRYTENCLSGDIQIEISHEALIRNWDTLISWLENERQYLRERHRFKADVEKWEIQDRDKDFLYRGLKIKEAKKYPDLTDLESDFLNESDEEESRQSEKRKQLETDLYEIKFKSTFRQKFYINALKASQGIRQDIRQMVDASIATDSDNSSASSDITVTDTDRNSAVVSDAQVSFNDDIREAVKRIDAGNFHEEDFRASASAIQSQQFKLVEQQTTGQRAISISGGVDDSYIFYNQFTNATNYNYGITREELRAILMELKSFDTQDNSEKTQKSDLVPGGEPLFIPDGESLVLSIDIVPGIIDQINIYLSAIEELYDADQISSAEQENVKRLRVAVYGFPQKIERELNVIADNANQILQNSIKSIKGKLRDLEVDSEDLLYEARSQVCLQEQIDILEEFQMQLQDGRVVSRWLERKRTKEKLAEQLSSFALDSYPEIREYSSPLRLEAFQFSIEQFLERLSHCLVWGRTNILDDPDTPVVFDSKIYSTAFEHLRNLIPERLPESGRENLQEYIDYLIQKMPTYQKFLID